MYPPFWVNVFFYLALNTANWLQNDLCGCTRSIYILTRFEYANLSKAVNSTMMGSMTYSIYFSFFLSLPLFEYLCAPFHSLDFCLPLFSPLFLHVHWWVLIELERPMPWSSWWRVMIDGRVARFIPFAAWIPCVRTQTSVFNYRHAEFSLGFS